MDRDTFIKKCKDFANQKLLSYEANTKLLYLFITLYYITNNWTISIIEYKPPTSKLWIYYLNYFKRLGEIYNRELFNLTEPDYSKLDSLEGDVLLNYIKATFDTFTFSNNMVSIFGDVYEKVTHTSKDSTRVYTPDFYASKLIEEVFDYKFGPEEVLDTDSAEEDTSSGGKRTRLSDNTRKVREDDDRIEQLKSIKIFDPACGSGALLIKAARRLKLEWETIGPKSCFSYRDIIENNLFGVDIDPRAVELSASPERLL